MALDNKYNSDITPVSDFFRFAQNFPSGFKSGEYDGKKSSLHFADSMSSLVFYGLMKAGIVHTNDLTTLQARQEYFLHPSIE